MVGELKEDNTPDAPTSENLQKMNGVRKRKLSGDVQNNSKKKQKIEHTSHIAIPGLALCIGEGDTGQLGLGESITQRKRPARIITLPEPTADGSGGIVQVFAGGMHSVCVAHDGKVYTFGCNDECALGRVTSTNGGVDEGAETVPGLVTFTEEVKVVQISAGDSHTAALTDDGRVFVWGSFRDSSGVIGLTQADEKSLVPKQILKHRIVIKIASGTDHLVCLSADGELFTVGCAEQGQLGRVPEHFAHRGGRTGIDLLLTPAACRIRGRVRFTDVWAGSYMTMALCGKTGVVYACGLNNYYQLGFPQMDNRFMLERVPAFKPDKRWKAFAFGQHHTLALDGDGAVYALGRGDYGRLGLGPDVTEAREPTLLCGLSDRACVQIGGGTACSFAIDTEGVVFSWGMGSSSQLGHGDEEADYDVPTKMEGKQLQNRRGLMISGGGQHTLLLVKEANNNST